MEDKEFDTQSKAYPYFNSLTFETENAYPQAVKEGHLKYCNSPDMYAFEWGGATHENFECAFLDSSSLFINGESQVIPSLSSFRHVHDGFRLL